MDLEATALEREQLEYATQHFGFTPDSFGETLCSNALDILSSHMQSAEDRCIDAFKGKVPKEEVQKSFDLIKDRYTAHVEKIMDNLGKYLIKNLLLVPQHVVLQEDRCHIKGDSSNEARGTYSGNHMTRDLEKYEEVYQEVINNKYKKAILEAKLAYLNIVAARQKKLLDELEKLDDCNKTFNTTIVKDGESFSRRVDALRMSLDGLGRGSTHSEDGEVPRTELAVKRKIFYEEELAMMSRRSKARN